MVPLARRLNEAQGGRLRSSGRCGFFTLPGLDTAPLGDYFGVASSALASRARSVSGASRSAQGQGRSVLRHLGGTGRTTVQRRLWLAARRPPGEFGEFEAAVDLQCGGDGCGDGAHQQGGDRCGQRRTARGWGEQRTGSFGDVGRDRAERRDDPIGVPGPARRSADRINAVLARAAAAAARSPGG